MSSGGGGGVEYTKIEERTIFAISLSQPLPQQKIPDAPPLPGRRYWVTWQKLRLFADCIVYW